MKYLSTLFVAIAIMAVGTVNAQTASKLNSQSYTYMMKNADGTGPEIFDKLIFGVGNVTSPELGKTGYTSGTVVERNSGAASEFDLTFTKSNGEKYVFTGKAEGVEMYGTIVVTSSSGAQSDMIFRGALTEAWDNMVKEREAAQKRRENKQ